MNNLTRTNNQQRQNTNKSTYSQESELDIESDSSQDSDLESEAIPESDDDIPLGQRHPDALKAQAILRSKDDTTKSNRNLAHFRNLSHDSISSSDKDDNQPLSSIRFKRLKSLSKRDHSLNSSNSSFPISVELLVQKLLIVQRLHLKPTVLELNKNNANGSNLNNHNNSNTSNNLNNLNTLHRTHTRIHPSSKSTTAQDPSTSSSVLKSPIEHISPISHFSNSFDHNANIAEHGQTNNNSSSALLNRRKASIPTSYHSPESKPSSSRMQTSHSATSQSLNRAKSLSEKFVPNNLNLSPSIPLPPLPTVHHLNSQPSINASNESRPSAIKALHLNTTITHNINSENHSLASLVHSPTVLSPCPYKKKLLIKLAIVNQSQSIMVEIDQDTLPKDLLKEAEQSNQLIDQHNKGTWGVFEVWRDLEIERPVREIEKIVKVIETWTSVDTSETYLLIQKNEISGLSVSKRSFTSGTFGGNLWCELKPGKWTKKFVLLRDNSIYLCSNDKGKDEMFLCTMEKFDVYAIPTWAHKNLKGVPREYSFGVKSLNQFSFFETKSDFVHKFSCKDKLVQLDWIRRLYDARTYIVMSQPSEEEIPRPKPADLSHSRSHEEKAKPATGLKRGKTLLGSQTHGRKELTAVPRPEIASTVEPITTNTNGGLTRKPTLLQGSSFSKFKQGTLLGKLEQQSSLSNGSNQMEEVLNPPLPAILPPHVMPLSTHPSNEIGFDNNVQADETNHKSNVNKSHSSSNNALIKSATSIGMNKARTWEQMGSEERKLYLNQVQNQAKLEGRTLLHFQHSDSKFNGSNNGGGGLLAGLVPPSNTHTQANKTGSGLNRSKTLGSHHGRSRPSRPAF